MRSDEMNRVKTSVNRADRPYISHQKLSKGSQYALCNSSSYVAAALGGHSQAMMTPGFCPSFTTHLPLVGIGEGTPLPLQGVICIPLTLPVQHNYLVLST